MVFGLSRQWKVFKEYMTEQRMFDLQCHKQILQKAYAIGLIDDQTI